MRCVKRVLAWAVSTRVPTPGRRDTMPATVSMRMASRMVWRLAPNWSHSSCSVGSRVMTG
ncbi:Uncharacterised protein [Achromobacter sp. 2789STDY5608615]|nr:Uncharacterised protein [Achromobacter sp. 2789STDY5608628]CUK23248.1 Uncharacterised protein [Achromobacter sp. 2789STDY5608615]